MIFRPMLACDADLDKLRFPLVASPKLDGVRAYVSQGVVTSRSGKPIPNKYIQEKFALLEGCDGELVVGPANSSTVFRDTMSHVMAYDKQNFDVNFCVFDHIHFPHRKWSERVSFVAPELLLTHYPVHTLEELLTLEEQMLTSGYEGLILRDPTAIYKFGRSTIREGFLLKLKRFTDCEVEVVGIVERLHNANPLEQDELGFAKRSSHQANMVGRGDMGALVVQAPDGVSFNVGTGFTDEERAEIWSNPKRYIGKIAKVKYFAVGVKDLPRHPVFLGWRSSEDIS